MEVYRSGHNGPHSKCGCRVTGTWVRIPPLPPNTPKLRFLMRYYGSLARFPPLFGAVFLIFGVKLVVVSVKISVKLGCLFPLEIGVNVRIYVERHIER